MGRNQTLPALLTAHCIADAGHAGQAGGALFYNGSEGSSLQYTYGALTANSVSFSVPDRIKSGLGGTL